ncbi:MAG: hypothetical protein M3115_07920, partial [Thermoproteota archaeon]|nr:hypothetical protein [Thermoproteota archaeon]
MIMFITAATVIVMFGLYVIPQENNIITILAANSSDDGKPAIVTVSNSFVANQSSYFISPNPFRNSASHNTLENQVAYKDSSTSIAKISIPSDARYIINQIGGFSQYQTDGLPRIMKMSDQSGNRVATLNNVSEQEGEQQQEQLHGLQNQTGPIRNL